MVVKVERGGSCVAGGRSVRGGWPPAGCREERSRCFPPGPSLPSPGTKREDKDHGKSRVSEWCKRGLGLR
ncbi:hypothetical protein E2C01_045471 [Portunus trituberculatus]|uniref:Uncharacterized protein n=1 Tax=Portunus trituberculatus TaxID=210409 RepID=A0A5B7FYG7_PORTR|nr:hypothetical protein [Portunus trituberculatus]